MREKDRKHQRRESKEGTREAGGRRGDVAEGGEKESAAKKGAQTGCLFKFLL